MVDRGLSVIPIIPGGKAPGEFVNGAWKKMDGWNVYANRLPSTVEVQYWSTLPGAGVGLVCGPISGIIGLDFDYDIDGLHEVIRRMIPDSPVKKVGAKGYTAFYRYNGERSRQWKREKQVVIEIISANGVPDENGEMSWHPKQTVLPPTLHPDTGEEYRWITRDTLLTINPLTLPLLPVTLADDLDKMFGVDRPAPRPISNMNEIMFSGPASASDVEKALRYIDPDGGYDQWIEVGMAIKTEFGDNGFDLWDQWSSTGGKYKAKEMPSKWRSFKRHEKKIASVFWFAQANGYVHVPDYAVIKGPALGVDILPGGNLSFLGGHYNTRSEQIISTEIISEKMNGVDPVVKEPQNVSIISNPKKERKTLAEINRPELLKAPGTVGEITQWITDTAIYPQPWLAIAAALALMGVVKAHRVGLASGLRTNVYTMGVAGSGTGKEHSRNCVNRLLFLTNQQLLLGGVPKSDAGLYNSVKSGNGRRLLQLDEFGKILGTLTAKGAAGHLVGIPTLMMTLFSSASATFIGAEYSNHDGKRGRTDIEQPCLCVHATTVPGRLYEAMTSSDAVDGFLSRWLIFETKDFVLDAMPGASIEHAPASILNDLEYWRDQPTNAQPKGNLDTILGISPRIIPFTPEAERMMLAFRREMRLMMKKHQDAQTGLDALYARTAEHAGKLALLAFEGDAIAADVFDWAAQMALSRTEYLASAVLEHVADNYYEAELKRVLRLIREAGADGISQNVLTRKTQFLANKKRRSDILQDLIDSGQVEGGIIETESKPKYIFTFIHEA